VETQAYLDSLIGKGYLCGAAFGRHTSGEQVRHMELSQWEELFPPHILARGKSYYADGRVERLQRQGGSIQALVRGSEPYQVELALERGQIADWYCSCPYAEDGTPCKHLAAVFCALEHGAAEEPAGTVSGPAQSAPLSELVEQLTLPEAKALLLKLASEYEPVADQIRMRAERPTSEQMKRWKNSIDQILHQTAMASKAQQQKMYQWFAKARETCPFDFYADRLLNAQLSLFHAPELLQKNLELVNQLIAEEKAKDNLRHGALAQLVLKRLEIMEELGAPQKELQKAERAYWSLPEIRQRVLERHLAAGETAQAEDLLRESKELDSGSPGLVSQYSQTLIELYQENNQEPQLLEELIFQVFQCQQSSLDYVKLLKARTPSEQWPELFEHLLSSQTCYGLRGELLELEEQYDRLFQYVAGSNSLWMLDRWKAGIEHEPGRMQKSRDG
jgi:hypothetical protein